MTEEKQEVKEEVKEEVKQPSLILSAQETADKLKEQNDRMEKNIAKLEELKAVETLGGVTNAGEQPPEKKEETSKEYLERIQQELREGKLK